MAITIDVTLISEEIMEKALQSEQDGIDYLDGFDYHDMINQFIDDFKREARLPFPKVRFSTIDRWGGSLSIVLPLVDELPLRVWQTILHNKYTSTWGVGEPMSDEEAIQLPYLGYRKEEKSNGRYHQHQ